MRGGVSVTERVIATDAALKLIELLKERHGSIMFHQSGGCCDGSSPMCYEQGDLLLGDQDIFYMIIETERLILRPWRESDAESLFEYAKDPKVGPIAGWPVHTSVNDSLNIIKNVLSANETYAVCLKIDNKAIGSIGLISPAQSHTKASSTEIEVGYWIGVPYWGMSGTVGS